MPNETKSHAPADLLVPVAATLPPAVPPLAELIAPDGYELREQVGQGGMGIVFRARDVAMNREVAVKILQGQFAPESSTAQRFVEEAAITGQLQHPGIPPVYHVGRSANGQPFMAMKLIRGETLEELLNAKAHVDTLAVFESICQAVGYAHAHDVIHRDLKPANIMVGAFGEVQVMDWGLAKLLTAGVSQRPTPGDPGVTTAPTEIRSGREDSDGRYTQAGSILGTPAYMAPEQAAGEIDKVDQRSDVFGLGALLCVLLTGKPPFTGSDADSVRLNAVRGRMDDALARLDACAAEPGVVALCKKCLAFEPGDRPANASDVAKQIAELRQAAADRARQAELAQVRAEVQVAEQRKRRRVLLAAGGALVAVLLLGIAGTTLGLFRADRARTDAVNAQKAEEAERSKADVALQDANRERVKAQARLEKAVGAVESMMIQVGGEKWAEKPELQTERRELLEGALAYFQSFDEVEKKDPIVRRQTARAHVYAAEAYLSMQDLNKAETNGGLARELYAGLAADIPGEVWPRLGQAESCEILGHMAALSGRFIDALRRYEEGQRLAEAACVLDPKSAEARLALADMCQALAMFYSIQRPDKSKQFLSEALSLGEEVLGSGQARYRAQLTVFVASINLAIQETDSSPASAAKKFEQAQALLPYLEGSPPPAARTALLFMVAKAGLTGHRGMLLCRSGKYEEGIPQIKLGIHLLEKPLAIQPKAFSYRYQKLQYLLPLSDALIRSRKLLEAEHTLATLERLRDELLNDNPSLSWLEGLGALERSRLLMFRAGDLSAETVEKTGDDVLRRNSNDKEVITYYVIQAYLEVASKEADTANKERVAGKAVELLTRLSKTKYFRRPGSVVLLIELMSHKLLADREDTAELREERTKICQEMAALEIAKLNPDQRDTGLRLMDVAASLIELKQESRAIPILDNCLDPDRGRIVGDRQWILDHATSMRLRICKDAKDAQGCRTMAELWEKRGETAAVNLFIAARLRGAASALFAEAQKPDDAKIEADRAMAWLTKANAAGYDNRSALEGNNDLKLLRDRDDFKALLQSLPKPMTPAEPKPD